LTFPQNLSLPAPQQALLLSFSLPDVQVQSWIPGNEGKGNQKSHCSFGAVLLSAQCAFVLLFLWGLGFVLLFLWGLGFVLLFLWGLGFVLLFLWGL